MLSDIVQAGTKALGGARFSLLSMLPGTVLAAVVLATYRAGAYGSGQASLGNIIPPVSQFSTGGAIVLVFALFLVGVLVQPFQIALVQLLEGYWGQGRLGRAAGRIAVEQHRRRHTTAQVLRFAAPPTSADRSFAQLAELARNQAAADRTKNRANALLEQLPLDPDHLMPTMLGNILRNGEDYAGNRYGLDALTVYPRMFPLLSKPLTDAVARQLDVIALTASMCVSFVGAALATAPVVRRLDLWSAVPVVALLLGVLAYRGALRAAEQHATLFAATFDLHRFDLLRALHYEPPTTVDRERELNFQLTTFLQGRRPPHAALAAFPYVHPPLEPAPAPVNVLMPGTPGGAEDKTEPSALTPEGSPGASAESPNPPNPAR